MKTRRIATAVIFAVTLFLQCIFFDWQVFKCLSIVPSKVGISVFIASFVLITPRSRRWWMYVVSFVVAGWSLTEAIYFRINNCLLDSSMLAVADNMEGYWDCIIPFVKFSDLLLFLPLVVLVVIVRFIDSRFEDTSISWRWFVLSIAASCLLQVKCFSDEKNTTVIHHLIADISGLMSMLFAGGGGEVSRTLSSDEIDALNAFIHTSDRESHPSTNLYIILFESLENWAISPVVTPELWRFFETHQNVLWSQKTRRQVRRGMSSDGQFIINTGLLPINDGALCFKYPDNHYPSLSSLFPISAFIQPGNATTWNQQQMCETYGIDDYYVNTSSVDSVSFENLNRIWRDHSFVMALTIASHPPFKAFSKCCPAKIDNGLPESMKDYLNSVHYTDACLGTFLRKLDTDDRLKSSTIVIAGDHTIFDMEARTEYRDYCQEHSEPYAVMEEYCPLFIYSPNIPEKKIIEEVTFQMDIYPTILGLIGCDSTYCWKGFGKNLLDVNQERRISEEDAFDLSEKMIESDFFKDIVSK